jgi:hypothetical protein
MRIYSGHLRSVYWMNVRIFVFGQDQKVVGSSTLNLLKSNRQMVLHIVVTNSRDAWILVNFWSVSRRKHTRVGFLNIPDITSLFLWDVLSGTWCDCIIRAKSFGFDTKSIPLNFISSKTFFLFCVVLTRTWLVRI